jgi:SAM-dependent methyltransferase
VTAPRYVPVDFVVETLRRFVVEPEQVVVDVGCGPSLYRDATVGRYIGVDNEPELYGPSGRGVDVVGAAEDLPLDDASADVLYTLSAFYAFPDHDRALAEFRRVLRPGGRLVLFDYNRRAQAALEVSEGAPRPKWTGRQLRRRVGRAGFDDVELLAPAIEQPRGLRRLAVLTREERRGQWAIVSAVRPPQ